MSLDDADGERANPNYFDSVNYRINCQSCVLAFEARCRGFDVEARPRGDEEGGSGLIGQQLANNANNAFIDIDTGMPVQRKPVTLKNGESPGVIKGATAYNSLFRAIDKKINPGERYVLGVEWHGYDRGHVLCIAKDMSGELCLIDPQSGMLLRGRKTFFSEYFKLRPPIEKPSLFRTDNAQISSEYANGVLRKKGRLSDDAE